MDFGFFVGMCDDSDHFPLIVLSSKDLVSLLANPTNKGKHHPHNDTPNISPNMSWEAMKTVIN